MSNYELKPCPFCGWQDQEAVSVHICIDWESADVCCEICGAQVISSGSTEEEARERVIKKWNTRTYSEGEVMLMGDKVFIGGHGHFTKHRECHVDYVKNGTSYDVYRYNCCGYEHSESRTDAGASEIPMNFCPNCGAKVTDIEWKGWHNER